MTSVVAFAGGLFVDLMGLPLPSGTGDSLTDFTLCDFPGYAQQAYDSSYAYTYDPVNFAYGFDSFPVTFQWTSPGISHYPNAYGYVVSDAGGQVCFWVAFPVSYVFAGPGDYLTFNVSMEFPATYA
jgi:hypothetical protein